jgi:hypothetical protein
LFFDDNFHQDLKLNLGAKCILVSSYKYDVDWQVVEEIYKSVVKIHKLVNLEFLEILNKFSLNKRTQITLDAH